MPKSVDYLKARQQDQEGDFITRSMQTFTFDKLNANITAADILALGKVEQYEIIATIDNAGKGYLKFLDQNNVLRTITATPAP